MTCVYLHNGTDILLIERSKATQMAPGMWAGVGGHLEPLEISDPRECAVREVEEETGIKQSHIHGLRLQAVLHRRRHNEIRLQYIYVGSADIRELTETDEGTLLWVPRDSVLELEMSAANRFFLKKYLTHGPTETVWVGTLANDSGNPRMQWSMLEDWEDA